MTGIYSSEQIEKYQQIRSEVFAEHPGRGGTTDLALLSTGAMEVTVRRFRGAPLELYLIGRTGEVTDHRTL